MDEFHEKRQGEGGLWVSLSQGERRGKMYACQGNQHGFFHGVYSFRMDGKEASTVDAYVGKKRLLYSSKVNMVHRSY